MHPDRRGSKIAAEMKLPEPPNPWGDDELTNFIDRTRLNCYASYANLQWEYTKLREIDSIFRKLNDSLNNTRDWFAAFFMLRAHSAFLAACHLGMAGQAAEAYALSRLSMENALYGFYLARNPGSAKTWLRRHDSAEAKRRVREEFKVRSLLDTLKAEASKEASLAEQLYERCIDYGGHPNERALTQSLTQEEKETAISFEITYLSADPTVTCPCLKTAAQVGAVVLVIFRLVYKERFDITGLSDRLDRATREL